MNQEETKIKRLYDDLLNSNLPLYDCKNCEISAMLRKIPHLSGLIVLTEEIDNKSQIVFVGESKNINRRCTHYFSDRSRNATLKRHVGDALIRIDIEKGKLKPEISKLWWDYQNPARFDAENYRQIEEQYIAETYKYIKGNIVFRLIYMKEGHRSLAGKILATLSKTNSFKSKAWIGNHATHEEVKKSGLWAMKNFTSKNVMQETDFALLEKLIEETKKM